MRECANTNTTLRAAQDRSMYTQPRICAAVTDGTLRGSTALHRAVCVCARARATMHPCRSAYHVRAVLCASLLIARVATVHAGMYQLSYGNQQLNDVETSILLDKYAYDASYNANNSAIDCGASWTWSPVVNPALSYISDATAAEYGWPFFVATAAQAKYVCYSNWDCVGVAIFSLSLSPSSDGTPGANYLFARYIWNLHLDGNLMFSGGADAVYPSAQFQEAYVLSRTTGYVCPDPSAFDPVFFAWAWGARMDAVYAGYNPIPAADDPPGTMRNWFIWSGSRLMPSPDCFLLPLLTTPASACTVYVAPAYTICPGGYREYYTAMNWCVESTVTQQVVNPTTYDTALAYYNDNMTLPCNYNLYTMDPSQGGVVGYDLSRPGAADSTAICYCSNPIVNDPACQFNARDYCDVPVGERINNVIHLHRRGFAERCSGVGVCTLDFANIGNGDWGNAAAIDVVKTPIAQYDSNDIPHIACACSDASLAPWCDRTPCANISTGYDCGVDEEWTQSSGVALQHGACEVIGSGHGCACNPYFAGSSCELYDIAHVCFTPGTRVGLSTTALVECGGQGVCNWAHAIPVCACAAEYSGPQCQYADCGDCGPLGACTHVSKKIGGITKYTAVCVCAVLASNPSVPLASTALGALSGAPCVVDLCYQPGTLYPRFGTAALLPGAAAVASASNTPPLAVCNCNTYHGASTILENSGVLCTDPVFPRATNVSQLACGVSSDLQLEVPRTCAEYPAATVCLAAGTTAGGFCDCEDVYREPGAAPYWLAQFSYGAQRYIHAKRNPAICEPYCMNGGVWGYGSCTCPDAYLPPRCEQPFCNNNGALVHGACACIAGYSGTYCERCNSAIGAVIGNTPGVCDACAHGFTRPASGVGCVPCATVAFCAPQGTVSPGGQVCAGTRDNTSHISCTCSAGYAGQHCGACAPGYARSAPRGACTACSTLLGCAAAPASTGAVCFINAAGVRNASTSFCQCAPNVGSAVTCAGCAAGYGYNGSSGVCVPCWQAAQCALPGTLLIAQPGAPGVVTLAASCPADTDPSHYTCTCDPAMGYSGARCDVCGVGNTIVNGSCTNCGLECGTNGEPACLHLPYACVCFNGYGGPTCSDCQFCGIGGACVSGAYETTAWCTCDTAAGYQKSPSVLGTPEEWYAPCDSCLPGYTMRSDGTCATFATVCGVGVDAVASASAGVCVCGNGYLPLSQQPSGKCSECLAGFAGDLCEPCTPSCDRTRELCAWVTRAMCVCRTGFIDSAAGPCSACDTPNYQGPYCTRCTLPCGNGTCTIDANGVASCACPPGTAHRSAGDETSPCQPCPYGTSPARCLPCPVVPCPAHSHCAEAADGLSAVCACDSSQTWRYARFAAAATDADECYNEAAVFALEASTSGEALYELPCSLPATVARYDTGLLNVVAIALSLIISGVITLGAYAYAFLAHPQKASIAARKPPVGARAQPEVPTAVGEVEDLATGTLRMRARDSLKRRLYAIATCESLRRCVVRRLTVHTAQQHEIDTSAPTASRPDIHYTRTLLHEY